MGFPRMQAGVVAPLPLDAEGPGAREQACLDPVEVVTQTGYPFGCDMFRFRNVHLTRKVEFHAYKSSSEWMARVLVQTV